MATLPPAPTGDRPQVVVRPVEVCTMCGARNSFRKIGGTRWFSAFGVAYARCCRCGHKAQIRTV